MKLFIPITGTLAAIGCAVWAYLSYTTRKKVVLHKNPRVESEAERT